MYQMYIMNIHVSHKPKFSENLTPTISSENAGLLRCKRTSGALGHLPGPSLSPVCANLLTADVIIGGARYVRTHVTLQVRATRSKWGGIAKVHSEQMYIRCTGALSYLPGSSLSPVCAILLTADAI
jgi:hypothetical protein